MRATSLFLAGTIVFAAEVKQSHVPKTIATYTMQSASLGMERKVNVLLPVDYETSTLRYPVLYLLHGYGDDQSAWSYMTNLSGHAAKHKVIVVMPDGGVSFYVNSVADPKAKFEDYIVKDLVAFTDATFRTIPLPRARAVAGLSMGGYGAAFIGMKHNKRYTAFGAFSGALSFARSTPTPPAPAPLDDAARRRREGMSKMFGDPGSPERAALDPFSYIEKLNPAEAPLIYIACGGQDFLIAGNRDFVKALAEKKIPYEYREISPRGHSWDFWDDNIRIFLDMLSRRDGWRID